MKRTYIILSLFILTTALSSAQHAKSNAFGVYLGMGHLKKQDLIFSPFIASDWSPVNVMAEYEHQANINHRASIRFGQFSHFVGEPFSYYERDIEYSKYPHSFVNLDLNYSLSKDVFRFTKWTISAGGRVRNRFQISNFDFGQAGQFSYLLSSGLDALVSLEYRSGKHTFCSTFALPIFSYLARSPYTGQDDSYLERIMVHGDLKIFGEHLKTGKIQSWGTSQMLDLELSYSYAVNSRWDMGITYLFIMNLHNTPVQYTSIENIIYFGTTFNF